MSATRQRLWGLKPDSAMVKKVFLSAILVSGLCAAAAGEGFLPSEGEPPSFREWIDSVSAVLGTSLDEAFRSFGVPRKVYSARGDASWQDDVVFEYAEGFSLFWYKDRVWQLRFGPEFRLKFRDAGPGSSREEIEALMGKPFHAEDDWMLYHFAGQGFPLRLRLFFGEKGLEDIYIYRGDF